MTTVNSVALPSGRTTIARLELAVGNYMIDAVFTLSSSLQGDSPAQIGCFLNTSTPGDFYRTTTTIPTNTPPWNAPVTLRSVLPVAASGATILLSCEGSSVNNLAQLSAMNVVFTATRQASMSPCDRGRDAESA